MIFSSESANFKKATSLERQCIRKETIQKEEPWELLRKNGRKKWKNINPQGLGLICQNTHFNFY